MSKALKATSGQEGNSGIDWVMLMVAHFGLTGGLGPVFEQVHLIG
jgi:hypothetical protein